MGTEVAGHTEACSPEDDSGERNYVNLNLQFAAVSASPVRGPFPAQVPLQGQYRDVLGEFA